MKFLKSPVVQKKIVKLNVNQFHLRVVIPREERGIEEFHDEEFLARKSSEENEEFPGLKKSYLEGKS